MGKEMQAAIRNTTIIKAPLNVKGTRGVKAWWRSESYICEGKDLMASSLAVSVKCSLFDPWHEKQGGKFNECEWPHKMMKGRVTWDETGISDVKLWRWPGRGIYAIFGRKPQRKADERFCGSLRYHQWLLQLPLNSFGSKTDGFDLIDKPPLALLPPSNLDTAEITNMHKDGIMKEKNWAPFSYKDPKTGKESLFMSYSIQPHIILEVLPNGETSKRYQTTSDQFSKYPDAKMHGGPSLSLIPSMGSSSAYYLGILHYFERQPRTRYRLYRHFAYQMSPEPPFSISAMSKELPLIFNNSYTPWKATVAYVSGLDVILGSSEDLTKVLISYGSADFDSRILSLSLLELNAFF